MAIDGKEQLEQMCAEPHESHCVKERESMGSCFLSSPLLLLFHLEESGLWMASVPVPHPAASVYDLVIVTVSGLLLL